MVTPQNARNVFSELDEFQIKSICAEISANDTFGTIRDDTKYFLAQRKGELLRGQYAGEMADSKVHNEYTSVVEGFSFVGVDSFRKAKPKATAFAAITAYHLYGWYRDNHYCGRCGRPTIHDNKERMVKCPVCGNMVFPKISPAVIVAVTDNDRVLLTKYAGRTYKNYALVG